jgi:Mg2+ and Co2+ transporter CorA
VPHRDADRTIAGRLADTVRAAPHGRTWRRVTTLLDDFGTFSLTPDVRERLDTALLESGLRVEPPLARANRHDTLRLSLLAGDPHDSMTEVPDVSELVTVTLWRQNLSPAPIALSEADAAEGVLWFDISVLVGDEDAVMDLVAPHCDGQLTREVVHDLLELDPRPKVTSYGESVRAVSTIQVEAREPEHGGDDPSASKAGTLVFDVVEIAAGDGWLVTTRHKSAVYRGSHEEGRGDPPPLEPLRRAAERRWLAVGGSTASDVGVAIMDELANSYAEVHRELYSWLESWELDFDERGSHTEQMTLKELRGLTGRLRVRLTALSCAEHRAAEAWLTGVTDTEAPLRVARATDRALDQLREISEALRSSLDILMSSNAQEQRRQGERLEQRLTLITSVLLVPTLVVGLYGANTKLPGRDTWRGFEIMVVLIVLSAVASFLFLTALRGGGEQDDDR